MPTERPPAVRYTVRDAADMLGITTGAVRNRLSRGTLQSVKEGGTVYVLLPIDTPRDAERDAADKPGEMSHALLEEMRGRIESLERQLAQADERDRENRRIIAALTQRIPAIEAAEPPESPVPAPTPTEASDEPQTGTQEPEPRSWWRRWFG